MDVDLVQKRGHNHVRRMRHGKIRRMEGKGEDGVAGVDRSLLLLPAAPSEFLGVRGRPGGVERAWMGQTNEDREGFIWTQTGNGIVVLNLQLMVRDRRNYFSIRSRAGFWEGGR